MQIFKFSDNLLTSIDETTNYRDQSQWENLMSVIRQKVSGLRAACAVDFENYTLNDLVCNHPNDEGMDPVLTVSQNDISIRI